MNNLEKLRPILSKREIEVVSKRLKNEHINQTESNYLSRSVRLKLKAAEFATSNNLLSLIDYRRKKYEREDKILKKKIMEALANIHKNIKAVIVFGSYIRNCHSNYRDIDIMIILNKKLWKNSAGKNKLRKTIENKLDIKSDINLIVYKDLIKVYPYSPSLQTQLENYKIVYGKINLGKKRIRDKDYLKWKLLEVEYVLELGENIKSKYIYNAIRTCLSTKLFLKKIISNEKIIESIEDNIGEVTANALSTNKANIIQRDIGLRYLRYIYEEIKKDLK